MNNSTMNEFIDISSEQNGQCLKKIIREGSDNEYPKENSLVSVRYSVTLLDGTFIYSNSKCAEPFKFVMEKEVLLRGWEVGIPTMKKNEIAVFHMESEYGYGKTPPNPKVPQDATVIFEIELLDWEGECIGPGDEKDAIIRYVINTGNGSTHPEIDSLVEVKYVGKYNGNVFDEKTLFFELGMIAKHNLPEGFELALQKFLVKEKSRIVIKPLYAFGETGCSKFGIPRNSTVEYIIELLSMDKAIPLWLMSRKDFFERASTYYDLAIDFFKKEQFEIAFRIFRNSLIYLELKETTSNEMDIIFAKKIGKLFEIVNYYLVQCSLKMNICSELRTCSFNLSAFNERNMKKPIENVENDFNKVTQIEANNEIAKDQSTVCDNEFKKPYQDEASLNKLTNAKEKRKKRRLANKICQRWILHVQANTINRS